MLRARGLLLAFLSVTVCLLPTSCFQSLPAYILMINSQETENQVIASNISGAATGDGLDIAFLKAYLAIIISVVPSLPAPLDLLGRKFLKSIFLKNILLYTTAIYLFTFYLVSLVLKPFLCYGVQLRNNYFLLWSPQNLYVRTGPIRSHLVK